jgi:tRNA pseudouridine13 synthase
VRTPRLTDDLPGTGGAFRPSPDDFEVEEEPAYLPSGGGEHTYVWIEKRDLTTPEAAARLARALGVAPGEVGWAGMKDRAATTRQWLSLPRVEPERARAAAVGGLRVLDAARHGNKLRAGHLHGNRFVAVVRGCPDGALERAQAILGRLVHEGLPNYYGAQRFGAAGDNVEVGLRLLRGEIRERDGRRRRLLISAVQSHAFNAVLATRLERGLARTVLAGDVLEKRASGGLFVCADPAADQPRLEAGEVGITGPMPGPKARAPAEGSPAAAFEAAAMAAAGIDPALLAAGGSLAEGTRRPLLVPLREAEVRELPGGGLRLAFALPAGAYATVLLDEVVKPPRG